MKKLLSVIASLALVAMIATSCGLANKVANLGSSNGNTTGKALTELLAQYLKDGTLDTSNLSNLINLATLASSIQGLKGNSENSDVLTQFAQGLVNGSNNQISTTNSSTITNILASLANKVDLSSLASLLTRAGEVTEQEVKEVAATPEVLSASSAVANIFKLMSTK